MILNTENTSWSCTTKTCNYNLIGTSNTCYSLVNTNLFICQIIEHNLWQSSSSTLSSKSSIIDINAHSITNETSVKTICSSCKIKCIIGNSRSSNSINSTNNTITSS